jgi:hypothetical protein
MARIDSALLDMADTLPECRENPEIDVSREVVLRQSRLHSGLAQVFPVLFALLAILAPAFAAPAAVNGPEQYVLAPADAGSETANLIYVVPGFVEDADDGEDQDEAAFPALAALRSPTDVGYQAGDAWFSCPLRFPAHFGTGPPML